jgi:DNA topoisomerase-1
LVLAIERLQRSGHRRVGSPARGFRYVRFDGRPLGGAEVERIEALKLPPAWTDVHVNAAPGAKLQAIGRDRAGRWQYRYHPDFVRRRAAAKYRRLLRFAGALPRIRSAVDRDMRRPGLSRERVLAAMVRILESCFMRPGSEAYARDNRSYGLATIRPRHVRVQGDTVVFDYPGKSGQRQVRELRDRRVARLVRALLAVPGRDVFKFEAGGVVQDVRRRHVNAYIREIAGAPFTAKDFRTWAGTVLCASELARFEREHRPHRARRKQLATAAVKAVAERLGNTPAVARSSYVSPAVLDGFARGRVTGCCLEPDEVLGGHARGGLHAVERAVVELLRNAAPRTRDTVRVARRGALEAGRAPGSRLPGSIPAGPAAMPLPRAARAFER